MLVFAELVGITRELVCGGGVRSGRAAHSSFRWLSGLRADQDVAVVTVLESTKSRRSAQARLDRSVGGSFASYPIELHGSDGSGG